MNRIVLTLAKFGACGYIWDVMIHFREVEGDIECSSVGGVGQENPKLGTADIVG